jgi:hypothetical protein
MAFQIPIKANADELSSEVPLRMIRLRDVVHNGRCAAMITREQYYESSQHDSKDFDIDGYFLRFGKSTDIPSTGYVPLKRRRPSARMDLPKVITDRFTSMVFGSDRFPMIRVPGDPDAEDFAQELAKQAKLPIRMLEARTKGGSQGSVVLSWGFVNGRPTIEVHNSAHCEVFEWADYERRRPGVVLKAYTYTRKVWTSDGKPKDKTYYYARFWDSTLDVCWLDIPEELAATNLWWKHPSKIIHHESGFCPVYWVQNFPASDDIDGNPDYNEGSHDNFDQIDTLLSMTCRGTTASVDPTVVIHASPEMNEGTVRTGTGRAIYSEKGAEYLELQGPGINTARELLKDLRQYELDKAGVVLLDPDKAAGTAMSASAMKQRYAVMLAKCDVLREQYGDIIVEILRDMLEVARKLKEVKEGQGGIKYWSKVQLPDRVEYEDIEEEEESDEESEEGEEETPQPKALRKERKAKLVPREPGESSNVELQWPPYFAPTWTDRKEAVETMNAATGGKQLVSQRTAVGVIGPLLGKHDIDLELGEIDGDTDRGVARAATIMEGGAPKTPFQSDKGKEDDEKKSSPNETKEE